MQNEFTPSSRRWLICGVVALALAGFFSIVLVVARTPQIKANPLFAELFHKALVVHVDLSVLVWFFCIGAMVMTARSAYTRVNDAALIVTYLGMGLMAISPIDSGGHPLMSNYIPVITSPIFFAGLALFFVAMVMVSVATLCTKRPSIREAEGWAARGLALIFLMSLAGFFIAYRNMPLAIEGEQYYEYLFWAGGHILQFAFTTLLMLGWLSLYKSLRPHPSPLPEGEGILGWMFLANTVLAAAGMWGFFYEPSSMDYRTFFTHHMIAAGSVIPVLMGGYLALMSRRNTPSPRNDAYLRPCLYMSAVLFIYGGLLAMTITGQDARIPAHYHGAIVAVTIAVMGMAYSFLPPPLRGRIDFVGDAPLQRLQNLGEGYSLPQPNPSPDFLTSRCSDKKILPLPQGERKRTVEKWMFWQPIVYGAGQIMHISGLAYSGGYGALRKTPGAEGLPVDAVIALGFMGLGGLLAIIGGLIFVVVMACSLKIKPYVI
jgi:cytochrome c oxidase subunit I